MNLRYTLAVALLVSTLPHVVHARGDFIKSDLEQLCQYDCRSSLTKIDVNTTDIQVALAYLLSKELPDCSFHPQARVKKEAIKYFVNRYLTNDSIDINAELPNVGQVSVLTNDQALEIGYGVANDLIAKKASNDILKSAGKTFVREKIVGILLWILEQSNLESLLPDSLSESDFYDVVRNEVARYGTDSLLVTVLQ